MKILIIEDEKKVALFLKQGLEDQAYETDVANDAATGKKLFLEKKYDLIILDVILLNISGFDICREIRKYDQQVPILMLTALDSTDDKVNGLDAGADDYLTKPFKFAELLARIRAINRRKTKSVSGTVFSIADLELNSSTKIVKRSDQVINLTAREFYMLEFLMKNANRVLSRAEIAENVWDVSYDQGTNIVDVYINYLRNKIDKGFSQKLIHTVIGMGYIIKEK